MQTIFNMRDILCFPLSCFYSDGAFGVEW